jgi:hypothetical protein
MAKRPANIVITTRTVSAKSKTTSPAEPKRPSLAPDPAKIKKTKRIEEPEQRRRIPQHEWHIDYCFTEHEDDNQRTGGEQVIHRLAEIESDGRKPFQVYSLSASIIAIISYTPLENE